MGWYSQKRPSGGEIRLEGNWKEGMGELRHGLVLAKTERKKKKKGRTPGD